MAAGWPSFGVQIPRQIRCEGICSAACDPALCAPEIGCFLALLAHALEAASLGLASQPGKRQPVAVVAGAALVLARRASSIEPLPPSVGVPRACAVRARSGVCCVDEAKGAREVLIQNMTRILGRGTRCRQKQSSYQLLAINCRISTLLNARCPRCGPNCGVARLDRRPRTLSHHGAPPAPPSYLTAESTALACIDCRAVEALRLRRSLRRRRPRRSLSSAWATSTRPSRPRPSTALRCGCRSTKASR